MDINLVDQNACRLCGGLTKPMFHAKVLRAYEVGYHCCQVCESLQTDAPYWLEEAYAQGNLSSADSGAVARNLDCQAVVYATARILKASQNATLLDFGGGNGLLCRLLRDRGFNAHVSDSYAVNDFAQGFEDDGSKYDIVCAFEVAEHLTNPKEQMSSLLDRSRYLTIVGTDTYEGQGENWWYLGTTSGQHVFFYSATGMKRLAGECGYHYERVGSKHIFLRRPFSRVERALLSRVLSERYLKWIRGYLGYSLSYIHAMKDHEARVR